MPSRLGKLLALLRPTNLLATALLALAAYGALVAYRTHQRALHARQERQQLEDALGRLREQNASLQQTVQTLEAQVAELRLFVGRLTAESRVADVRILGQERDAAGVPVTRMDFIERGRTGAPLPPRPLTLRGQEVYFDALLIKFSDDAVKVGDPLRGKSLHLFRRAFGSAQQPQDGPLIAASETDGVPDAYRSAPQPTAFERRLWRLFWHWAAHPDEAAQEGVRVAQIEAVAIRPIVGATYRITLEHDGGLNIKLQQRRGEDRNP